jgi:hypothetical protein
MTQLIPTRYIVMRPEQSHESATVEWPREPSYAQLRAAIGPLLDGGDIERVSVLADPTFSKGTRETWKPLDMFVDEDGHSKGLPRNEAATLIYRRNWLLQHPETDPESMPHIVGPAVLFSRRVWF